MKPYGFPLTLLMRKLRGDQQYAMLPGELIDLMTVCKIVNDQMTLNTMHGNSYQEYESLIASLVIDSCCYSAGKHMI